MIVGIAVLTMTNKPANLIDLEFLTDMNSALDTLHADETCRGLIITSVSTMLWLIKY